MKPATGKLGVMTVGLGAVSTTFITGVLMARKGLAKPIGALTQYDKIRVGHGVEKKYLPMGEIISLAQLNDIMFGAWDVYPANGRSRGASCEGHFACGGRTESHPPHSRCFRPQLCQALGRQQRERLRHPLGNGGSSARRHPPLQERERCGPHRGAVGSFDRSVRARG